MSLLSSSAIGDGVCCLIDEEADHNMLQDLQLAAELGKTLLERNKELENIIKAHQTTVEEQAQEIEYMKKQTAALREVNDSRLKIYEQLEVSIQDLERANHRLVIENTSDKKLIKSQCLTIESLETRCEELQKKIDEITEQHESLLRQRQQQSEENLSTNTAQTQTQLWKASVTHSGSIQQGAAPSGQKISSGEEEEVTELLRQLQETRSQRAREQKKVTELEQQLANVLQDNNTLEEQLNVWRNKAQDIRNLQEEINTLEEVRQGQLCGRCLRGMESKTHDDLFIMLNQEEYDDISMTESLVNDSQREIELLSQDTSDKDGAPNDLNNPYRVLVEKYQALLEVQRQSAIKRKDSTPAACMSLQEELEMSGEFNSFQNSTSEPEAQQQEPAKPNVARGKEINKKAFSSTPTDFSEAETLSSGFSDETSNKMTQTEDRPGSFLCSIADGEDCKFSIYDDNSPFESRFRKTPEYRQLFQEIFTVLKRAAEAKDGGEKLPLLDVSHNLNATTVSQPQSSVPLQEDIVPGETTDDNQSVVSSVLSSTVSEPVHRIQVPVTSSRGTDGNRQGKDDSSHAKNRRNADYVWMNGTKKPGRKHAGRKHVSNDRSTTPDVIPTTNPKFISPKSNRRKFRPFTAADQNSCVNNGGYNYPSRVRESPNPSRGRINNGYARNDQHQSNGFEYREYAQSSASKDVARLKRLEMSYAEVLQFSNKSKLTNHRRN
ncbi:cerebellar degeneration-related protein 2-like isoform X2 [Ceratina calcarata]|uniref:Cerebellar degeneration-related protein 2-like isoform X2 n=1 Tax=Ceratina calcarata TaxID=156304 RepID=A0AAJ7N5P6_9HYME|nr:cerebellar degeneration-related protein 2-like isoform X2 [Ceratina calcarata]